MKKPVFIILIPVFFTLFMISGMFGWLITPESLRSFVYRELSYLVISHHLTVDEKTELGKVKKIFQFVHDTLHIPTGYPALDKTVLNDFIRGIGWCDQQSWALAHLADKAGIRGSLMMLRGNHPDSGHTVARLFLGGEYRIFDPLYGIFFLNPKKGVATFDDFSSPRLLYSEKFQKQKAVDPDLQKKYFGFFDKKYPPIIWSDLSEGRPLPKRMILSILKLNYRIWGDTYAHLFQNLYLRNEQPFYKARNYHLYFRYKEAEKEYSDALRQDPSLSKGDEILFHLATLYYNSGRTELSEQMLTRSLMRRPKTAWAVPAHHYLELIYEKTKKPALAYRHFLYGLEKFR